MAQVSIDPSTGQGIVLNTSGVAIPAIAGAMRDMDGWGPIVDSLMTWHAKVAPKTVSRNGSILDRDRYVTPDSPFEKMRTARLALKDDVVGGAADGSEAISLAKVSITSPDTEQEDVWNQWAGDIDLDDRLRVHWRELYRHSQCATASWWEQRDYQVRGVTKGGNKARKRFRLNVPTAVTFIDPTKVSPVGSLMFGKERLAYVADPMEAVAFDTILAARDGSNDPVNADPSTMPASMRVRTRGRGRNVMPFRRSLPGMEELVDPIVQELIVGRYVPDLFERQRLDEDGVPHDHLFVLNPARVWRHTLTRPDYERFAEVRLESVFELLDLKAQLRQMDRSHLLGGANWLLVIRKGSDAAPADQDELDNLRANAHQIASTPIVVGDHRLQVDIITPSLDVTLNRPKYDTLDTRLFARCWGTFVPTGEDTADPVKLGRVIAQNLQSRRQMMRRSWELNVFQRIRDANPDQITERAKLQFHPKRIQLSFDDAMAALIVDLRQGRGVSRQTVLDLFDLSQTDEARQLEREAEDYDDIFREFNPFGPQGPGGGDDEDEPTPGESLARRRAGGRQQGGRRNGGGAAQPGSGQGQEPRNPRSRSGGGRRARSTDTVDDKDDDE